MAQTAINCLRIQECKDLSQNGFCFIRQFAVHVKNRGVINFLVKQLSRWNETTATGQRYDLVCPELLYFESCLKVPLTIKFININNMVISIWQNLQEYHANAHIWKVLLCIWNSVILLMNAHVNPLFLGHREFIVLITVGVFDICIEFILLNRKRAFKSIFVKVVEHANIKSYKIGTKVLKVHPESAIVFI